MPILAKEPELYPLNLLDEEFLPEPDAAWFAMYTLARQEKELVRQLQKKKIAHYCPMAPQRKRSPAGRIRTSYIPLFTGYVFVCGSDVDRYEAVSTGCVSRCLDVREPEQLHADLRRIYQLAEFGEDVRPEPRPLVGRPAMIRSGAMAGMKGTISKVHSQHRLTVMVNFMQQGASIVVDEADVELL